MHTTVKARSPSHRTGGSRTGKKRSCHWLQFAFNGLPLRGFDQSEFHVECRFYAPDKQGSCRATCLLLSMVGHEALHVHATRFSTNKDVQGQFRGKCTKSMLAHMKCSFTFLLACLRINSRAQQTAFPGPNFGLKGHIKGFKMSWSRDTIQVGWQIGLAENGLPS